MTMNNHHSLFADMETTLAGNLLRYAAGRAIFCPKCGAVMDWQRTIICGGITTCEECWREVCQRILDERGADNFACILGKADVTSAHNWHIENGKLVKGAQLITD
jgi:hypothetical protein